MLKYKELAWWVSNLYFVDHLLLADWHQWLSESWLCAQAFCRDVFLLGCCKHNSTETALLYIHDHLINAIGSQKVSCLCLLDLSAAFDTIDHNILISHLSSWFGIHGSVLSWFKSHLSSRSFRVKCDETSSFHTSSCGVPQGSVLGPLLFVIYTTPHCTLISSLSLDHHLY